MTSILRTLVLAAALVAATLVGFKAITTSADRELVEQLRQINLDMQRRLDQRQAMIGRLSRTRRVAHVVVTDQRHDLAGTISESDVLFIELDDNGSELARQEFTILGSVLFIDAWTVKFDHTLIADGDPLAGRTLILLRRVFSELMPPVEGLAIDTPGAAPPGYAASDHGRFEQQLWQHFWKLAVDPDFARSMGVRVAQGEAVYQRVRSGQQFDYVVDAAGGVSLTAVATVGDASDASVGISSVDG